MTHITDEMIQAGAEAIRQRPATRTDGSVLDAYVAESEAMASEAIKAAYPLIRKQVLEEAAMACDRLASIYDGYSAYYNEQAKRQVCMKSAAEQCAQAIRDMAKEAL